MPSLKEVKNRIISVSNTKKITSARQMVSSAQLHRAQGILEHAIAYKHSMDRLTQDISNNIEIDNPYMNKHNTGAVAVVIMSSNSGMCGSFNANMIKVLQSIRVYFPDDENILFFPIGKKIREAVEHEGYNIGFDAGENMDHLAGKTTYKDAAKFASYLLELYTSKKVKHVELIYYSYKSMAIQEIKEMTLLPYSILSNPDLDNDKENDDFIWEPSQEDLLGDLIPMVLRSNFYYALMENQTSEHAARTMAMQLATENADEILGQLQLTYNKLRQQNITSELLDIIGGSFA